MTDPGISVSATRRPVMGRGAWAAVPALALASLAAFLFLDASAVDLCRRGGVSDHDPWLSAFREIGKAIAPIWLLLVFVWATNRRRALPAGLLALALVALTVLPIKAGVQRLRPCDPGLTSHSLQAVLMHSYSFPSGDTATAFAVAAVFLVFLSRRWGRVTVLLAAAVGLMRMLQMKHYFSDVLAGAALGLLCGYAGVALATYAMRAAARTRWARWTVRGWRGFCGGAAVAMLAVEGAVRGELSTEFLRGFGALVAFVLVVAKCRAWFRWLKHREQVEVTVQTVPGARRPPEAGTGLVLVLLGALTILPTLGWTTLYDRDEGYYVECAREMLARGQPFVPHFAGQPWLEKPPLGYWLMALSMKAFGPTEFAARLPSAVCALLAIWLTFHLGRMMYSLRAGVVAGAALGTTLLFSVVARLALVDMPLICCVLVSMIGLWKIIRDRGRGGIWLFYLGAGVGFLVKSLLGIALPILAALGYILWTRRWGMVRRLRPVSGGLIVLAVLAFWAVPAWYFTGWGYFHEMLWIRTLRPIFTPLQGHGAGNLLQYLALLPVYVPVLLIGFIPWTLFLPAAGRRLRAEGWRNDRPAFLSGWVLMQLAAFSLVTTKMPHYVLPFMPALAIVVGATLVQGMDDRRALSRAKGYAPAFLIGGVFLGGAILAMPFVTGFPDQWPWFLPAALIALSSGCWISRRAARNEYTVVIAQTVAATMLCFALLWQFAIPRWETGKSARRLAQMIKVHYAARLPDVQLATVAYDEKSLVFYLPLLPRQGQYKALARSDVPAFLAQSAPAAVVITAKELTELGGPDPAATVVWRDRVWIIEHNHWVDVFLITNGR